MASATAKYPTRPLESFAKLKEVRRQVGKDTFSANERGKVLILGGEGGCCALYGAFDAEVYPAMPTGKDMRDLNLLNKLNEAAEAKGFTRDCCATLRIALGAYHAGTFGLNAKTGEQIRPDIAINLIICQGQVKSHQLHGENFGIPVIDIECPWIPHNMELAKKRFIETLYMTVEKMEKVLDKKCDDEKLIRGTINEWRVHRSMSEMVLLQKTVPAPVKQRNLASFSTLITRGATFRSDVADFYELALEEVKERVKEGIAGFENERFRLFHEGNLPWHIGIGDILRYPEKYDGTYIGSLSLFGFGGCFVTDEQGSWHAASAPWEMGREIRSREDAFDELAELYVGQPFFQLFHRSEHRLSLAKDCKIDGVVLALDRGCVGITSGLLESALLLKEGGIPAVCYETSSSIPADFDEKGYHRLMDRLMESLEGK
ncbi:MAG: 2-hydroxyacyl-CoA dehydratase [Thermodesulfobacteriota bacterium]|nr:2-hydroxyacyl-CoA dehydratase [Thermodesulfobacteriota bacterium]